MAELDQDKVAPLHLTENFFPPPFGYKRSAAASTARSIENVDLVSIKVADERISPTLRAISIVVGGRIADDEKRRQVRIDRSLFSRAQRFVIRRTLSLSNPGRNTQ